MYFVWTRGISIGDDSCIAGNTFIAAVKYITDRKVSAPYHMQGAVAQEIIIGQNVWIYANCVVLGGVTIGNNSIVAASSVVTKDVPENVLVVGAPAKIVK